MGISPRQAGTLRHDGGGICTTIVRDLRSLGSRHGAFLQRRNRLPGYINNERDIDFFHWSSVRMSEFWRTSFDVTLASQRARVGTAAAEGDWRKTVQQYGLAEAEALARG